MSKQLILVFTTALISNILSSYAIAANQQEYSICKAQRICVSDQHANYLLAQDIQDAEIKDIEGSPYIRFIARESDYYYNVKERESNDLLNKSNKCIKILLNENTLKSIGGINGKKGNKTFLMLTADINGMRKLVESDKKKSSSSDNINHNYASYFKPLKNGAIIYSTGYSDRGTCNSGESSFIVMVK